MADVKSKNMYELLGNDPEEDSDREPEPPTKAKTNPVARIGKRDGPSEAPAKAAATVGESRGGGRGGRGRGRGGSEGAFHDRDAGRAANKSNEDYVRETDRPYRGRGGDRGGRGRGGRGRTFHDGRDDRRSHGRPNEHVKQADQSWGAPTGDAEYDDEKAGEAIAKDEAKDGTDAIVDAPVNADGEKLEVNAAGEIQEPEEVKVSYADYLVQQAEKKLALGGGLEARKANEGSKVDKKWSNAQTLESSKAEEELYFKGSAGKASRQREQKAKTTLDIDHRFVEQPSARGDRESRGRGGRGRGEGRGSFRGERGSGRGRGEGRGAFRGERGGPRGGRGGASGAPVNTTDESAFPSLGSK